MAYTKTVWEDLPSTNTPITAENLNNMEDGIETNDKKLSGEEVIGNIVVDSIRTKNLFDSNTIVQGDVAGSTSTARVSTRQILWLEPGTYTFSTNMSSTYRFGIIIRPSAPPTSSTSSYDSGWLTDTSTHTFTITTAGYYMMNFAKTDNTDLTAENIKAFNFQLEEGSTATTYSPFQELKPQKVVLYENPSGVGSSFTIADYWRNYKELEIYFLTNGWLCNSAKMDCDGGNSSLILTTQYGVDTANISILSVVIQFDNKTVLFIRPRATTFASGSANVPTITTSADIKVTKVIGYR